jgi:hypothetical protein
LPSYSAAIAFRYVTENDRATRPNPEGDAPLSNAERQVRYRERHRIGRPGVIRRLHRPPEPCPRPQRWHDAVDELLHLQGAYASWLEALADALRETATAKALRAIVDLDLEPLAAIEQPRGFGRD